MLRGPGSIVGIATGYELDGPGMESRWGRDFPHLSRPVLGPTQPPVQWVSGLSPGGKERPGRDTDPSLPSSAVGHERVELYLYSPCGPYGLYWASVLVQGCTLHFYFIMSRFLLYFILFIAELNYICGHILPMIRFYHNDMLLGCILSF